MIVSHEHFHLLDEEDFFEGLEKVRIYIHSLMGKESIFFIAISECANNAMEHGLFPVKVTVTNTEKEIKVTVEDSGKGFNVSKTVEGIWEKGTSKLLEEKKFDTSGRGILLQFEICDKVIFDNKGTKVTLIKRHVEKNISKSA